jgi:hypothetical protein
MMVLNDLLYVSFQQSQWPPHEEQDWLLQDEQELLACWLDPETVRKALKILWIGWLHFGQTGAEESIMLRLISKISWHFTHL